MASTFTDLLRLEQMATGEKNNTWGDITNDTLNKIEQAIASTVTLTFASADITLTTNAAGGDGLDDQAVSPILNCKGTLSANVNLIAPKQSKSYIVANNTTGSFTLKIKCPLTTGGNELEIPQGDTLIVWCDPTADSANGQFYQINALVSGVVAQATNADQLGTVVAANYAQKAVKNVWTNPQIVQSNSRALTANAYQANVDTDGTIKIAQSEIGASDITMSNPTGTPTDGQVLTYAIEQHGTTPVSVIWGTNFIFADDVNVDLTQTADAVDYFTFQYNSNLARWVAAGVALNFPRS